MGFESEPMEMSERLMTTGALYDLGYILTCVGEVVGG